MAKIRLLYNAKTQKMNKAILIDLRKAFDYADRYKIRENIQRYLTPDEAILPNLILDVYQMIDVTIAKQIIKPTRGVPQGSVFSSLFFILMLNDILVATIPKYPNIRMTEYIDDIIMQGNSKEILQEALIRNKHLEINVDKTEYLMESNTEIIVDNITATQLKRTSTAKYLGQIIEPTCCNEQQITQKIIGKVNRYLSNRTENIPARLRIKLYSTYIRSQINHLIPLSVLIDEMGQIWKQIRSQIFHNILQKQTTQEKLLHSSAALTMTS